jgi:hypothetical protein
MSETPKKYSTNHYDKISDKIREEQSERQRKEAERKQMLDDWLNQKNSNTLDDWFNQKNNNLLDRLKGENK